jgi:hypothetical protein
MGCDIHIHAERKTSSGGYERIPDLEPFGDRRYGTFGFLAGVRNYSGIQPIAEPRGIPEDISSDVATDYNDWGFDAHSASWLSVDELVPYNYDQTIEDRRMTRQIAPNLWDGGCTAEPGEGKATTLREFLGEGFFEDIEKLKSSGADRIVFWFDN